MADRAPAVLPWAPLVAQAIGVPVQDTEETKELDEEFRRPRLARAVLDLLAGLLPDAGLLVIDDAHFMDEASADLFGPSRRGGGPDAPGSSASPGGTGGTGFTAREDTGQRLDVGPLRRQDALALARRVAADHAVSPRVLDIVVDRSGGNPLFLKELLAAVLQGDDVDRLPDDIGDVVAARIDGLTADDRFLLRQLSVLGQSFPADLARDALDELPHSSDPVWRRLDEFVDVRATTRSRSATGCSGTPPTTASRSDSAAASTWPPAGRSQDGRSR